MNVGETLTLDCSFVGFPTPNITWTLNNSVAFLAESGVSVDTSQSGSGSTSRLTFTNVTPATALGNYSCFVSNVVGNTSRNFTVLVARESCNIGCSCTLCWTKTVSKNGKPDESCSILFKGGKQVRHNQG